MACEGGPSIEQVDGQFLAAWECLIRDAEIACRVSGIDCPELVAWKTPGLEREPRTNCVVWNPLALDLSEYDHVFVDHKGEYHCQRKALKHIANRMAVLLCVHCRLLERHELVSGSAVMSSALRVWWEGHKREDEERKKKEGRNRLRQRAAAKLTADERDALGIG